MWLCGCVALWLCGLANCQADLCIHVQLYVRTCHWRGARQVGCAKCQVPETVPPQVAQCGYTANAGDSSAIFLALLGRSIGPIAAQKPFQGIRPAAATPPC